MDTESNIQEEPRHKKLLLFVVFLFIFIKELFFVVIVPPWQNHDEPAHFSYTQYLVEEKRLPNNTGAVEPKTLSYSLEYAVSEVSSDATRMMNAHNKQLRLIHQRFEDSFFYYPNFSATFKDTGRHPLDRVTAPEQYRDIYYRLPSDNQYRNSAAVYQPLYYALEAVPYLIFYNNDIVVRLYAMRIFSLLFYIATIAVCYLLAMRLTKKFSLSITLTLIIGLQPVFSHLVSGVNNETLLILLCTLTIYWCVRIIQKVSWANTIWLGVTLGLGMLTKPQFIIFPLLTIIPFGYHFFITKNYKKQNIIGHFLIVAIIVLLICGWWFVWAHINHNGIFAPGESPIMGELPVSFKTAINFFTERWIYAYTSYNYAFGFATEMVLPTWTVVIGTLLCMLSGFGLIKLIIEYWRKKISETKTIVAVMASAIILLEAFFIYLFSKTLFTTGYSRFPIDGRYYIPIIFNITLIWLFGLRALLPQRCHRLLYAGLVIIFILINTVTIFNVVIPKFYL